MSRDGNQLWGWQSQEPDGSWSLIAMYATTLRESLTLTKQQLRDHAPQLMVLIHRDPRIARTWRTQAMAHRDRYGQPVRFARFDNVMVVEEIEGRDSGAEPTPRRGEA